MRLWFCSPELLLSCYWVVTRLPTSRRNEQTFASICKQYLPSVEIRRTTSVRDHARLLDEMVIHPRQELVV